MKPMTKIGNARGTRNWKLVAEVLATARDKLGFSLQFMLQPPQNRICIQTRIGWSVPHIATPLSQAIYQVYFV